MKPRLILLLAGCASAPALAQHSGHAASQPPAATASRDGCPSGAAAQDGHAGHGPSTGPVQPEGCGGKASQPSPAAADPHAGHAMPTATSPAPGPRAEPASPPPANAATTDPHAGHAAATPAETPPPPPGQDDPHTGHTMAPPVAPSPPDPHAGHAVPAVTEAAPPPRGQTDPHAGHATGEPAANPPSPPVAPPPPEALQAPAYAADQVYGTGEMTKAREEVRRESGDLRNWRLLFDQLEVSLQGGRDGYVWDDAQFWYGGDIDKLWIKSQGEGEFGGRLESAEVQALWSHAIDPWFDLQAGVRYDFEPDPSRGYLVVGVQGLAPYWFEVDGALFLSNKGDLSGRVEVEYDQRITQRLILQPRVETEFAFQDVPEIGIGSGLSTAELGLRLRYEIFPARAPAVIAPYVGVQYERAFGDTADFRRAAGDRVGGWSFIMGVRTWF